MGDADHLALGIPPPQLHNDFIWKYSELWWVNLPKQSHNDIISQFQILLGWVGDFQCVNASIVYAGCMVACGLVTLIMPLLGSYFTLASASGAFGACIAANYSLTSIILVEQITLEKFTNAYGLLLLIQGVANLIGPPLAG